MPPASTLSFPRRRGTIFGGIDRLRETGEWLPKPPPDGAMEAPVNLQLTGALIVVAVLAAAGVAHKLYSSGAANAEYRLVAEAAQTLRKARDREAALKAAALDAQAQAEREAAEATAAGHQAAQAARERVAAIERRPDCPAACFVLPSGEHGTAPSGPDM